MVHLAFLVVWLVTVSVGHAEVQDVTTVFRLRETDAGDEFLAVSDCFGQTRFCPWFKSGWDVEYDKHLKTSADKCTSNLTPKHSLPAQQLSEWIPIYSNHSTLLTIKPNKSKHTIHLYLSADGIDGNQTSRSMVLLALSSEGNHQAYACLRVQQTGESVLIHELPSVKASRKCSPIPTMFLPRNPSAPAPVSYEFEYNSETGELAVNAKHKKIDSSECVSMPLTRQGYSLPDYVKYLRLISYDADARFTKATPGLLLKDLHGIIVSPDIEVTPNASRLCLSISVNRNVIYTGLDVVVRARDGREIKFENANAMGVDLSTRWKQIYHWNYVADLKAFENQTVDIQIIANSFKKGNFFISAITKCNGFGGDDQMTFIHQSATLEIHGNVDGATAPFILPDDRVLGANVGVPSDCTASQDGCAEWAGFDSPDWIKKSSAQEKDVIPNPNLRIGLQHFFDSIGGTRADENLGRQFVDGVNILLHGANDQDRLYPKSLKAVLWDGIGNLNAIEVYVLEIKLPRAGKTDMPLLYKCAVGTGNGKVTLTLTPDVKRTDCTVLKKGESTEHSGFTTVEELWVRIAIVKKNNEQEIQVTYDNDSTMDNEKKVLTHRDSSITVARYMLSSPEDEPAFATSYGIGSVFYSLEVGLSEVSSPFFIVPEDGQICLALDYFFDGKSTFNIRVIGTDGEKTTISRGETEDKRGTWRHETVKGRINAGTEVTVNVTFTKQDASRFLLQRLSFCHHEDNETAIYERPERIPVAIFHPGAQFATANGLQTPSDAKVCHNGGVLKEQFGCDCPAGFNDTECQNGCGPNRYGNRCQHICSYSTRGCRGMLMGRPYLGFNCGPGFGGPLCDISCKTGVTYGAGCLQKCGKCATNTVCDPYSGVCPHGCEPGLIPPRCQEEFAYLTTQPMVSDVTKDSAKLTIARDRTAGRVQFWQVQYKLPDSIEWLDSGFKQNFTDGLDPIEHTLYRLLHGTQHQARFILLTLMPGGAYQGDKILAVSFTTLCDELKSTEYSLTARPLPTEAGLQISWQYPTTAGACKIVAYEVNVKGGTRWNVYRYPVTIPARQEKNITHLLPTHTYQLRVRAITTSKPAPFSPIVRGTVWGSIKPATVDDLRLGLQTEEYIPVLWYAPRFTSSDADLNYEFKYQCIGLLACPAHECSDQKDWSRTTNREVLNLPVKDLLAHARYRVWIRAVGRGQGGKENHGKESSIFFDTPEQVTAARPVAVEHQDFALNTEDSVTVVWEQPSDSECPTMNGAFLGFYCRINDSSNATVATAYTFATFSGLKSSTNYEVKVFVRTSKGINETSYIKNIVKTHSPSPGKVDNLTVYSKGILNDKATLSIRWNESKDPNTVIDYYVVASTNFQPVNVTSDKKCPAWPGKICYQISELEFSTNYTVSVQAVSKDGEVGAAVSVQAATYGLYEFPPGKPSFLHKKSSTADSITISVGIPEMLNGDLESFQVTVNRITGPSEAPHKFFKTFEVSDKGEQFSYEFTLTKLKNNGRYKVRVKAQTMSGAGEEIAAEMAADGKP